MTSSSSSSSPPTASRTSRPTIPASPHYGERWARHWIDTARYSDTRGLQVDQGDSLFRDYRYAYAWTYRDYVINAMNEDKPYDKFVVEQLAADRIPAISWS